MYSIFIIIKYYKSDNKKNICIYAYSLLVRWYEFTLYALCYHIAQLTQESTFRHAMPECFITDMMIFACCVLCVYLFFLATFTIHRLCAFQVSLCGFFALSPPLSIPFILALFKFSVQRTVMTNKIFFFFCFLFSVEWPLETLFTFFRQVFVTTSSFMLMLFAIAISLIVDRWFLMVIAIALLTFSPL